MEVCEFNFCRANGLSYRKSCRLTKLSKSDAEQYRYAGKDAILCVIENGKLNVAASTMTGIPAGVRIGSIDDFSSDAAVMSHLFTHASFEEEAMVALNTMLCYSPIIIKVDAKVKCDTVIQLIFATVPGVDPLLIPARVSSSRRAVGIYRGGELSYARSRSINF